MVKDPKELLEKWSLEMDLVTGAVVKTSRSVFDFVSTRCALCDGWTRLKWEGRQFRKKLLSGHSVFAGRFGTAVCNLVASFPGGFWGDAAVGAIDILDIEPDQEGGQVQSSEKLWVVAPWWSQPGTLLGTLSRIQLLQRQHLSPRCHKLKKWPHGQLRIFWNGIT